MRKVLLILIILPFILGAKPYLRWDIPTTNADGTPLTDLAGFKIYCGLEPGKYDIVEDIPDPAVDIYEKAKVLTQEGNYYCAATAYDTSGNESGYSNEINFSFGVPPGVLQEFREE